MDNTLNNFAKKKSRFVKLDDYNGEITCTIISYAETLNMQGDEVIAYKLVLDGDTQEKILQSGSAGLARQIANLPNAGVERKVRIKRTGEGFQTKYEVECLDITEEENQEKEQDNLWL